MININKINLNFHETFSPDLEYISKIIYIADKCDGLTKEEISDLTGIPTGASSGKVEPHINYAKLMNLIEFNKEGNKYYIYTTSLGKVIRDEDLYFLENVSKLVCNYFLTSKIYGATMWSRIIRVMSDKYGDKIKESVILKDLFEEFNIKIKLSPFKNCYKNQKSFESLQLINIEEVDNENLILLNKNKYEEEMIYVYAYTLLKEIEVFDDKRTEFSIDEIFNIISWQKGFCWDDDFAMKILEKLSDLNIIVLNRQLNPITVIANTNSEEIVDKIYSLLI